MIKTRTFAKVNIIKPRLTSFKNLSNWSRGDVTLYILLLVLNLGSTFVENLKDKTAGWVGLEVEQEHINSLFVEHIKQSFCRAHQLRETEACDVYE
jgi:hypothetical protein